MKKNQECLSQELAGWGVIRVNKRVSLVWLLLFWVIAAGAAYSMLGEPNDDKAWFFAAVRLTMAMQVIVLAITGLRWYYGKRIELAVKDSKDALGLDMNENLNRIVEDHHGVLDGRDASVQKQATAILMRAVFVDVTEKLRKVIPRRRGIE